MMVADFSPCALVAALIVASLRGRGMKLEGRECDVSVAHAIFLVIYFLQFWLVPAEAI